ncbi:hypothetical protein [Streptomyces sp. NPDC051677]|uniref:hypothetical protein n=1 Tax=Streptomyces sp. NPDC051677 TaxID=3365669 RepID=UPI0037D8580D
MSASASGPGARNASGTSIQPQRRRRHGEQHQSTAARVLYGVTGGLAQGGRPVGERLGAGAGPQGHHAGHRPDRGGRGGEERRARQARPGECQVGDEQQRAREGDRPRRQVPDAYPPSQGAPQHRARRRQCGRCGQQRQTGHRGAESDAQHVGERGHPRAEHLARLALPGPGHRAHSFRGR